mmetsp:Transcript_88686/g.255746  ORF Transcript_88686/g.255746 Transcript_88686/m.255746 type:complete len:227 (-) Transcript_88686:187-867(-)
MADKLSYGNKAPKFAVKGLGSMAYRTTKAAVDAGTKKMSTFFGNRRPVMNSPGGACWSMPAAATSATNKTEMNGAGKIAPKPAAMPAKMYVLRRRSVASASSPNSARRRATTCATRCPDAPPRAPRPASSPRVPPAQSEAMQPTRTFIDSDGSMCWCFISVMKEGNLSRPRQTFKTPTAVQHTHAMRIHLVEPPRKPRLLTSSHKSGGPVSSSHRSCTLSVRKEYG